MTPFWSNEQLTGFGDNVALVNSCDVNAIDYEKCKSVSVTYRQLTELITTIKVQLSGLTTKSLIMVVAKNTLDTVATYLACLQLKHVVWFVDQQLSVDKLAHLQRLYQVNVFVDDSDISWLNENTLSLHNELALVITTSGSTGSPDIVKLSYDNLAQNCRSICQVLPITSSDKVITTLPLQYSFGLSILNTHLNTGAAIVLTQCNVLQRDFWQLSNEHKVTSFYGVPSIYQTLLKFNLNRFAFDSYRYFSVAGGKLPDNQITEISQYCDENEKEFYVMYGQTEATARISCLSPKIVSQKPNAIGKAIPEGKLWLEDEQQNVIKQPNAVGELCYKGPNVMMGLAKNLADLAKPKDSWQLRTGDLAYVDVDGNFTIVGRLKRMIKINGHRINLDEIEKLIYQLNYQNACVGQDDNLVCFIESSSEDNKIKEGIETLKIRLCEQLNIHSSFCRIALIQSLPELSSGKVDYQKLGTL